eukprot:364478-Chlamydomonas_euryale.AAC.7
MVGRVLEQETLDSWVHGGKEGEGGDTGGPVSGAVTPAPPHPRTATTQQRHTTALQSASTETQQRRQTLTLDQRARRRVGVWRCVCILSA